MCFITIFICDQIHHFKWQTTNGRTEHKKQIQFRLIIRNEKMNANYDHVKWGRYGMNYDHMKWFFIVFTFISKNYVYCLGRCRVSCINVFDKVCVSKLYTIQKMFLDLFSLFFLLFSLFVKSFFTISKYFDEKLSLQLHYKLHIPNNINVLQWFDVRRQW